MPSLPRILIVHALAAAHGPVPIAEIRDACKIRNARLYEALAELIRTGRVFKADGGYVLTQPAP